MIPLEELLRWFQSQNGTIDGSSMGITEFPNSGRGAIALVDIPGEHTLFTIPRELTLSTRTSSLPARIGRQAWKELGLEVGWVGLILCMMWEEAQGSTSRWFSYLASLPSNFDTPMFWSEDELDELKGTAVIDKIGKSDAERDYNEKLLPAVKSRPELFLPEHIPQYYSLARYHIMGSRILSRSFHVEPWGKGGDNDSGSDASETPEGPGNPMDVDSEPLPQMNDPQDDTDDLDEDGDEEEDTENPADVAMVPMADMLNAQYGSGNVKLFYEKHDLRMVTTKPIQAGEQIWNTYGDPPNSDLLRRYGHVDLVPLPPPLSGVGNPADVVEIRADLVVVSTLKTSALDVQEKVDWWLENADDDTFVLGTDCDFPDDLVSFVRLMLLPRNEWEKTKMKSKLPKAKVDAQVLSIVKEVLERRLQEYSTTAQDDEKLLSSNAENFPLNKKHAVIVRLGEKRILHGTLGKVQASLVLMNSAPTATGKGKKRVHSDRNVETSARVKKARR
ncbi:SET domain-containing protein [Wolfiporia cocos MD-104 SS10]|uniref:Ribosomal lysine N-methyltransferase 4 n=1 Tax=Wolfiporia cocos (strain MD-104) TaxID=742152 RepID=A0A2H3J184_WOLCO|nr:SET domain-containing protein [Wolfiporia cocos MD-104 SS10]